MMQMRANLPIELLTMGALTTALGFVTTRLVTKNQYPRFDDSNLKMMMFVWFLVGVLAHLVLEYSGQNKKYCDSRA